MNAKGILNRLSSLKIVILCYLLFNIISIKAQNNTSNKEILSNELKSKISDPKIPQDERLQLLKILIKHSKKSKSKNGLYDSYALAAHYTSGTMQLAYGDSLLLTAKLIGTSAKLGDAHMGKGMILVGNRDFSEALDHYLKAYEFLRTENDQYLLHNLEYNIAQTKNYLGLYEEARVSLEKAVSFFRNNHEKINGTDYRLYYLYSIIALIDTNSLLGYSTENHLLLFEGKKFLEHKKNNDLNSYLPYLISSEGIQAYNLKMYSDAIRLFNKSLSSYTDHWGHLTDHFYLGMSYWETKQHSKALEQFTFLDEELNKTGDIDPKFRPAFEKLYEYYQLKKDKDKQLEYINKLLILNKKYENHYKNIHANLRVNYDIKRLENDKQSLLNSVVRQKYFIRLLLIVAFLLIAGLLYSVFLNRKRKKQYKKLYSQYILHKDSIDQQKAEEEVFSIGKSLHGEQVNIAESLTEADVNLVNPLVENHVLMKLSEFEKAKKFLKKEVSLKSLAIECRTNTAYLSKIINTYKGSNFKTYLIDLRLQYTMDRWRDNPESRLLSIQETALASGFSTAQSFSKNFQAKYEVSPKYFLQQLNKEKG